MKSTDGLVPGALKPVSRSSPTSEFNRSHVPGDTPRSPLDRNGCLENTPK